jgi:hypothetical protein
MGNGPRCTRHQRVGALVVVVAEFALVVHLGSSAASLTGTSLPDIAHGSFSMVCPADHSAPDDPIVHPGQPGASHLHDFYGNRSTDAFSTEASMRAATTTCPVGADTAGYWSPAGYLNGVRLPPVRVKAYYLNMSATTAVETPPAVQMVAGVFDATSAADNPRQFWNCAGNTPLADHPYDCSGYSPGDVVAGVDFPSCWNGNGLARTDVIYPVTVGGPCPVGFSHVLPTISLRVHFGIDDPCAGATPCGPDDPDTNVKMSLASGPYYTFHADFWNTWDPAALDGLVSSCLNQHQACGEQGPAPPSTPVLSAVADPTRGVKLSWTGPPSPTGPITGYDIFRSKVPGAETILARVPASSRGFRDIANARGTTFYYEVRPFTGDGPQALSNEVSAIAS